MAKRYYTVYYRDYTTTEFGTYEEVSEKHPEAIEIRED